jgi:hypothetical protein
MKTTDILEWIVKESINGEFLGIIDVPEEGSDEWEQNENWWIHQFGFCPPHSIPSGKYLYFYVSQMPTSWGEDYMYPDAQIEICNTGDMYDYDYINLYKLED